MPFLKSIPQPGLPDSLRLMTSGSTLREVRMLWIIIQPRERRSWIATSGCASPHAGPARGKPADVERYSQPPPERALGSRHRRPHSPRAELAANRSADAERYCPATPERALGSRHRRPLLASRPAPGVSLSDGLSVLIQPQQSAASDIGISGRSRHERSQHLVSLRMLNVLIQPFKGTAADPSGAVNGIPGN